MHMKISGFTVYDHTSIYFQRIKLDFEFFNLEGGSVCQYDNLTIYDGLNTSSPMLSVFCGDVIPQSLSSSGNVMFLELLTDHSVSGYGFVATVTMLPRTAGKHMFRFITLHALNLERPSMNIPSLYK